MRERSVFIQTAVRRSFGDVQALLQARAVPSIDAPIDLPVDWLHDGATSLQADLAGVPLEAHVRLTVSDLAVLERPTPRGTMSLEFRPLDYGALAPELKSVLEIQPIDEETTMLTLLGHYAPPFGAAGLVADRVVMHTLAEKGLRRFMARLVRELRVAAVPV